MDKWVIMFKGGVETQEFFSIEMAHTFEAEGYNVYWFDLLVSQESSLLLQSFLEQNRCKEIIIFTFNFSGISGETGLYGDEWKTGNLWDEYELPVYNMVVDHPLYYHKAIALRPKRYVQLSIDFNHIQYMKRFFPEVNASSAYESAKSDKTEICVARDEDYFLPLGGTGINLNREIVPDKDYLPLDERPIDVIFTGNYTPPQTFEKYLVNMDPDSRAFFHQLVRENIDRPDEITERLLEEKLIREAVAYDTDSLRAVMPNLMYVDLSVRFFYRAKVITTLADNGIKVHTYGAGWNLAECKKPENIVIHGNVDSRKCLDMLSQSKLSVNVMPWFKRGAHDRIFNSMLNGAAVVSDGSEYICRCFDKDSILMYNLNDLQSDEGCEMLAGQVKELLKDRDRLENMVSMGYSLCIKKHTWAARTMEFIDKCLKIMV